ncbi:hypothetical protein KDA_11510 [Dictyobacter alpinus]|uniref:Peptidase C51 domain-containing protein n=1 Tax=Dictyobacter alpinus TaxID=2014873 RepID=A0A402B2X8_9CHLR|nr:CHAP domain-containing protein [Dictyobacter alpinus]GCE25667.1 hypothetical protein KDA_11510 [Dictyobacter alpinus]
MLSSDRYRKRKNIYRQRNRIAPLAHEAAGTNMPIEQLPFPKSEHFFSYDVVHTPPLFPPVASNEYILTAQPLPNVFPDGGCQFPASQLPVTTIPQFLPVPPGQALPQPHLAGAQRAETIVRSAVPRPIGRPPILIPATQKRRPAPATPLQGRRLIVHGALSILSIFIAVGGVMALVPVDKSEHIYSTLSFPFYTTAVRKNDTALIQAQAATATAVTVDGFDPGGGRVYAGVKAAPLDVHVSAIDSGSLRRFFYGQCTYWANQRYHEETGHWIPWLGNAYQWAYQAPAYGWNISSTPNPHGSSIMVFGPYAEGAGAYGHVAVVERVNGDGSVLTSNWNWNGDWATLTWHTFYPGRGISFLWYPD